MTMCYDEVFWLSLNLFHFKLALSGDSGGHALMFLGCIFRNGMPDRAAGAELFLSLVRIFEPKFRSVRRLCDVRYMIEKKSKSLLTEKDPNKLNK